MFSSNTSQVSDGGYQISRSLRFDSAASAYLGRTPTTASNRKTWTWSGWVKRTKLGVRQGLFSCQLGAGLQFGFLDTDVFQMGTNSVYVLQSTQVFRDPSAWYHIVVNVDTTLASNRCKVYINGTQITAWGLNTFDSTIGQNVDTAINLNNDHALGQIGTSVSFLDGYMTEINFIDGQALTPSSFGATDAQTGVWGPKAFSGGAYGTNGFYLNFSDNSNTTAATLGKDYSGNGNNWIPNGFLVSAGVNNDSLVDSPTSYGTDTGVGGTVRGNYCTLNPLDNGGATVTNGNLDWDSASNQGTRASFYVSTGQYYWEITSTEANLIGEHGVAPASKSVTGGDAWPGSSTGGWGFSNNSGNKSFNGTQTNITSAGTNGDVMMYALNMDTGKIWFGRNGTWFGSGNPASGTNEAFSGLTGTLSPMTGVGGAAAGSVSYNFGQRPFAYTAPSGFKALCTQNLPVPSIGATTATQAGKFFNTVLYTGNAPSSQSITGVGFQPDFVWVKNRSNAGGYWHGLFDSVRGVNKVLVSNSTMAEDASLTQQLNSFNSDGFTVGTNSDGGNYTNLNANSYVGWNWKASNATAVTNTSGTITSTVSANTTSGFSIVTWNGTGANATVGHGLGVAPSMILIKSRSSSSTNWNSYHVSVGAGATIILNTTSGAVSGSTFFNSTAPTSTVFSLGSDGSTNPSGAQQVAYCFAPVSGYSAMGSYIGNGSADGPFIYTGFRPAFVLIKRCDTTSGGYWRIYDSTRNTSNVVDKELYPNDSSAEGTFTSLDFTSNGIKIRNSDSQFNGSSATYLYMAFASTPLKFSLAR